MDISTYSVQSPASTTTPPATSSPTSNTDQLANTDTFLQLLVAQIKNQDPLQPTDGVQFLSQLAQFSSLEQLVDIRQGVDALKSTPAAATADPTAANALGS